ncbi:MAG: hypothetical protein KUG65_00490 [Sphingomonadaceae bacterium]|nr:hypothetical protein [Sphingomonadaceae bacterium]
MAKQTHSKANGKLAITRHPLFPLTVALWFGALFGLGSLAVRASLLESAIVALKIDMIITSAAPPIGATTRILLALAMAALGGLLGAMIARRIGRPKKVVQKRKRGAGSVSEIRKAAVAKSFANRAVPEAPAAAPASGRRSQLAMKEEAPNHPAPDDTAPVPGSAPQILDVSAFELEGFESPASDGQQFGASKEFAIEDGREVEPTALSDLDSSDSGPFDPQTFEASPPEGAQIFKPQDSSADLPTGQEEPAPIAPAPFDEQAAAVESTEPAATNPQQSQPDRPEPQMIFGTAAPIDANAEEEAPNLPRFESEEDRQEALVASVEPYPASVFDPNPAPSLFAQPLNTSVSEVRWSDNVTGKLTPPTDPAACPPIETASLPEPEPDTTAPDVLESESAAQRIASTELNSLSPLELLERLAISIRRKHGSAPAEAAPANPANAQPSQLATPQAFAAPEPQTEPAQEEVTVQDQPQTDDGAPAEPIPAAEVAFAPSPPSIPAGLRPVGLDPDDDEELLPHYLPPRRIGMEHGGTAQRPENLPALNTIEDPGDKNAAPGDGYSSLLDLSQPAPAGQGFVRVDEPEEFDRDVEPAVIFPGQETSSPSPFAPPAETLRAGGQDAVVDSGGPEAADATLPGTQAETDQPAPFAPPATRPDPAETERALRSALTTPQRMSGAA